MKIRGNFKDLIEFLLGKKDKGSLRAHLARSTAGTFALKISFSVLGFLPSLLANREVGPWTSGLTITSYADFVRFEAGNPVATLLSSGEKLAGNQRFHLKRRSRICRTIGGIGLIGRESR